MTPREKLAAELRAARLAAGFTSHDALAATMAVDRSLVTKAESPTQRVPSDALLTAWAEHTGKSPERWVVMAEVCRTAADGVPGWFEDYLRAEGVASVLRFWNPNIVTPIFHTADYARALLLAAQTDISPEHIDPLVAAKLDRQSILDRSDAPEVIAVIDEPVLHKLIGTSETMYEQLIRVAELSERPNITVQVVPADIGATAGLSGDIAIAVGDGIADTLHTDAIPEGHTTDSASAVRQALVAFERIRGLAHPRALSRQLILEVVNERWKQQ
jgi:hypothetical protein